MNATLKAGSSAILQDGTSLDVRFITMPFKQHTFREFGHLFIRDKQDNVDYLPSSGRGDIVFTFQIPVYFLKTGMWTFYVDARAGDEGNTCLFAGSVTQWLEGDMDDED